MPKQNDELKNGNGQAGGDGAENGSGNGDQDKGGNADEMITVKKSDYDQIVSDRDNYRTAVLDKKAKERELKQSGQDGEGSDKDKDGQGQSQFDETKVKEIAKAEINAGLKQIHDANEYRAKRQFLRDHPEYQDDAQWQQLMGHYSAKRGKNTTEDMLDDLEDTVLLHKRATGKLDEYMDQQKQKAREEGRIQGMVDSGRNMGGTGDRNDGAEHGSITPTAERMAGMMHVDVEKVKKVDVKKDRFISQP